MELRNLSGHTIDVERLPERPVVLDVGCRGFDFTRDILALRPKSRIIALDPDPEIEDPRIEGVSFMHLALVHDDRRRSGYASYSTGEGNMLTDAESYYDAKILKVDCVNITALMDISNISRWDVVKLDCEGSEFEILANWPGQIAQQISVEFHDGHPEQSGAHRVERTEYFDKLWKHLQNYKIIQHPFSKQGDWYGHWDTLLTL